MKGKMPTVFALMTLFVAGFSYAAGSVANSEGSLSQMANKINTQVRYRLTYQEMDKNTDGQVTKEEYQAAIIQHRENAPDLGANQNANMFIFEELDVDGDTQLSQQEFNQHLATTNSWSQIKTIKSRTQNNQAVYDPVIFMPALLINKLTPALFWGLTHRAQYLPITIEPDWFARHQKLRLSVAVFHLSSLEAASPVLIAVICFWHY